MDLEAIKPMEEAHYFMEMGTDKQGFIAQKTANGKLVIYLVSLFSQSTITDCLNSIFFQMLFVSLIFKYANCIIIFRINWRWLNFKVWISLIAHNLCPVLHVDIYCWQVSVEILMWNLGMKNIYTACITMNGGGQIIRLCKWGLWNISNLGILYVANPYFSSINVLIRW